AVLGIEGGYTVGRLEPQSVRRVEEDQPRMQRSSRHRRPPHGGAEQVRRQSLGQRPALEADGLEELLDGDRTHAAVPSTFSSPRKRPARMMSNHRAPPMKTVRT